jgi:DNA-binding SARP family transcriptional activator
MSSLRINLLGCVRVQHDGETAPARLPHRVQALLAYLVLHRERTHRRETLSALFWGEQSEASARSCLSTSLWRLRQILEPPKLPRGMYLLADSSGEVGFKPRGEYWLDIAVVEDAVRRLRRDKSDARDLPAAERALEHYTGDLLDGFYDEWALRERERVRLLYLDGLSRLLVAYMEVGNAERALHHASRILELDPLREEIHREVIRLHLREGRRALAVAQFQQCREVLARELSVEPMPETRDLVADLLPGAAVSAQRADAPSSRSRMLSPLREAVRALDTVRDQLRRALEVADAEERIRNP